MRYISLFLILFVTLLCMGAELTVTTWDGHGAENIHVAIFRAMDGRMVQVMDAELDSNQALPIPEILAKDATLFVEHPDYAPLLTSTGEALAAGKAELQAGHQLELRVVDFLDRPLRRARAVLTFHYPELDLTVQRSARCPSGACRLSGLPAGQASLSVTAPDVRDRKLTLEAGEITANEPYSVMLEPRNAIYGYVENAYGEVLDGATLVLEPLHAGANPQIADHGSAITDAQGRFLIDLPDQQETDMALGVFHVTTQERMLPNITACYEPMRVTLEFGTGIRGVVLDQYGDIVPEFVVTLKPYCHIAELNIAFPEIKPGLSMHMSARGSNTARRVEYYEQYLERDNVPERRRKQVQYSLERLNKVAQQIADMEQEYSFNRVRKRFANDKGEFVLGRMFRSRPTEEGEPKGMRYQMVITADQGSAKLDVDLDYQGLNDLGYITLTPAATLSGQAVDRETGRPVPGVKVQLIGENEDNLVNLVTDNYPSEETDDAGRFAFRHIEGGEYQVRLTSGSYAPARSPVVSLSPMGEKVLDPIALDQGNRVIGHLTCRNISLEQLHAGLQLFILNGPEINPTAPRDAIIANDLDYQIPRLNKGTYQVVLLFEGNPKVKEVTFSEASGQERRVDFSVGGTRVFGQVVFAGQPVTDADLHFVELGGKPTVSSRDITVGDIRYSFYQTSSAYPDERIAFYEMQSSWQKDCEAGTDEDGYYSCLVPEGTRRVAVVNGHNMLHNAMVVIPAQEEFEYSIQVQGSTVAFTCLTIHGELAVGAFIQLIAAEGQERTVGTALTGADGRALINSRHQGPCTARFMYHDRQDGVTYMKTLPGVELEAGVTMEYTVTIDQPQGHK